jgi:hypothetical protein
VRWVCLDEMAMAGAERGQGGGATCDDDQAGRRPTLSTSGRGRERRRRMWAGLAPKERGQGRKWATRGEKEKGPGRIGKISNL